MNRAALALALAACVSSAPRAGAEPAPERQTITFPAPDGLPIVADLYVRHPKSAPLVVLFHQAGWSRGEYREIAPKLLDMGYNAMAIDARSGGVVNKVVNQTHARARRERKGTSYVDALVDLRAALKRARRYTTGKVIAWGSSYSSALVLRLAGTEPELADVWLAFAPGEYFGKLGKSRTWIREAAAKIREPVFITSARREHKNWKAIYAAIPSARKAKFVPESRGNHGSRALWSKFADSGAYWSAVRAFLARVAPASRR